VKTVGVRCSRDKCRKRRCLPVDWKDYEFSTTPYTCICGSTKFVEDAWRKTRGTAQRCDCLNYNFPHRKHSQKCRHHPLAEWHIARDRYGVQGEELHDIWLECTWAAEGGQCNEAVPF
jgi:hypothetical protein